MTVQGGEPMPTRRIVSFVARWAALSALAVALVALAPGAEQGGKPPAATVRMTEQMRYDPPRIRIHVGDTVLWENASSLTHTVTADPSKAKRRESTSLPDRATPFHSGMIGPGGRWEYTFTTPGTYRYFCMPHEAFGMVATVEVVPVAAPAGKGPAASGG